VLVASPGGQVLRLPVPPLGHLDIHQAARQAHTAPKNPSLDRWLKGRLAILVVRQQYHNHNLEFHY